MCFNYSGSFYVPEYAFTEMLECMRNGYSAEYALTFWAVDLGSVDFYIVEHKVKEEIIAELERRFKENDN